LEIAKRLAATLLVGVYVGSPIDVVPDFIIGLGHFDDIAAVLIVLGYWVLYLAR
jgi:uncharacterized membrane protein YkvA (DUF1232 family)